MKEPADCHVERDDRQLRADARREAFDGRSGSVGQLGERLLPQKNGSQRHLAAILGGTLRLKIVVDHEGIDHLSNAHGAALAGGKPRGRLKNAGGWLNHGKPSIS